MSEVLSAEPTHRLLLIVATLHSLSQPSFFTSLYAHISYGDNDGQSQLEPEASGKPPSPWLWLTYSSLASFGA